MTAPAGLAATPQAGWRGSFAAGRDEPVSHASVESQVSSASVESQVTRSSVKGQVSRVRPEPGRRAGEVPGGQSVVVKAGGISLAKHGLAR